MTGPQKIAKVRELSDAALVAVLAETDAALVAEVAVMALLDAAVRALAASTVPAMSTAQACAHLSNVLDRIVTAEARR